jgi:hypothetical protein
MVAELVETWEKEAGYRGVIHPNLRAILGRRGFSDQTKLLALLRRHVRPNGAPDAPPVDLHILVAPLRGVRGRIDGEPATTYAKVLRFGGASFDDAAKLEEVFVAATASAAFPLLFAPVDVPGLGPCTDGGLVNNTPILNAVGVNADASLDAIVVATPAPALAQVPEDDDPRGLGLVAHALDMVFGEWLYQDLRRAHRAHEALARLDVLARQNGWSREQLAAIKSAMEVEDMLPIPVISIRPVVPLPGTLFSGFVHGSLRRQYIETGVARARQVLDRLGWD